MNRNLPTRIPSDAITAPTTPVTTASMRNGSCVYQRVAPTSRITPTSTRRVNAETCTVLEISSSAAMACTSATRERHVAHAGEEVEELGDDVALVDDVAHADLADHRLADGLRAGLGSSSFTRSVAGSDCGRTTSASDWPLNSCR